MTLIGTLKQVAYAETVRDVAVAELQKALAQPDVLRSLPSCANRLTRSPSLEALEVRLEDLANRRKELTQSGNRDEARKVHDERNEAMREWGHRAVSSALEWLGSETSAKAILDAFADRHPLRADLIFFDHT
jgi:hypothetical protein